MQLFPDINDSVHININSVPPWYSQCPLGPCYQHQSTNFKCQRCDFKSYLLISKVSLLTFCPRLHTSVKEPPIGFIFTDIFPEQHVFLHLWNIIHSPGCLCSSTALHYDAATYFTFINKIKMQLLQFRCHFCLGFYNTLVSCAALL